MRLFFLVSLFISGAALTSCAGLDGIGFTAKECATTNWRQKGFELAESGEKVSTSYRARSCTESNPQYLTDYNAGFSEGVKKFCTQDHGLYWGRKDADYKKGFCPRPQDNNFLVGYSQGKLENERLAIQKRNTEALEQLVLQDKSCMADIER